jgi:indolepyruvate ferredoxin oxidoreductase beta subunit
LPFSGEYLWGMLEKMIPEKYRDVNRRVFDRAIESISGKTRRKIIED